MAAEITIELKGAAELIDAMRQFTPQVKAAAVRDGVAVAARDLAATMRTAAYLAPAKTPKGFTHRLRKALRAVIGKGSLLGFAWVGLERIPGESRVRYYYKTLEAGRGPSKRRVGKSAGKVGAHRLHDQVAPRAAVAGTNHPLRPFFAAAWAADREKTAQLIVDATRAALYREAEKVYARTKASH